MLGFQEDHGGLLLIAQYGHAYGRSSNDLPRLLQEICNSLTGFPLKASSMSPAKRPALAVSRLRYVGQVDTCFSRSACRGHLSGSNNVAHFSAGPNSDLPGSRLTESLWRLRAEEKAGLVPLRVDEGFFR